MDADEEDTDAVEEEDVGTVWTRLRGIDSSLDDSFFGRQLLQRI
jgi:hypothetical protein